MNPGRRMVAARGRVGLVAGLAVLGVLVALAVRSCGERRPGAQPPAPQVVAPSPSGGPATPSTGPSGGPSVEQRSASVPLGLAMPELRMVFGSADVGYGLLSQCENDAPRRCRSALLVTLDGGQSWVERQLPEHGEAPLWIKVVDATTIGLFADDGPAAAWLSRDTGRTFQRRPRFPPPAETVPDGWVADCLGLDCARQVYEYRADGPHRLTTQPPLHSPLRLLKFDGTRLWAGAVAPDGRPELAVSRDRGNSWKRSDPPVAALRIGDIEITVSPDGRDVWLVQRTTSGESAMLARFDPAAAVWRPVRLPDEAGDVIAAAALGNGELAATTFNTVGYLVAGGTRWVSPQDMGIHAVTIGLLSDGTLAVTFIAIATETNGNPLYDAQSVLLGVGGGTSRQWIQVRLVPSQR